MSTNIIISCLCLCLVSSFFFFLSIIPIGGRALRVDFTENEEVGGRSSGNRSSDNRRSDRDRPHSTNTGSSSGFTSTTFSGPSTVSNANASYVGTSIQTTPSADQPYGHDTIQKLIKSLSKDQLLDILKEMKKFTQNNPEGAKQLLCKYFFGELILLLESKRIIQMTL